MLPEAGFQKCFPSTKNHHSQSLHSSKFDSSVAPGFGATVLVMGGRGSTVVEGGPGGLWNSSFVLMQAGFGRTRGWSTSVGPWVVVGAAAAKSLRELQGGVRVQRGADFWAGKSRLRFPLRTRGGEKRRERRWFQQTFRSLCALSKGMEAQVMNEGTKQRS